MIDETGISMCKRDIVREHLNSGASLTNAIAKEQYGINKVAEIVCLLRKEFKIHTEYTPNPMGRRATWTKLSEYKGGDSIPIPQKLSHIVYQRWA